MYKGSDIQGSIVAYSSVPTKELLRQQEPSFVPGETFAWPVRMAIFRTEWSLALGLTDHSQRNLAIQTGSCKGMLEPVLKLHANPCPRHPTPIDLR